MPGALKHVSVWHPYRCQYTVRDCIDSNRVADDSRSWPAVCIESGVVPVAIHHGRSATVLGWKCGVPPDERFERLVCQGGHSRIEPGVRANAIVRLEGQPQLGKECEMRRWDRIKEHVVRKVVVTQIQPQARLTDGLAQRLLGLR